MKEVNSSRQKELNANLQKKELVGQLKNVDVVNAIGTIHACFNNFRKNKRNETKTFSSKWNCLIKDGNF